MKERYTILNQQAVIDQIVMALMMEEAISLEKDVGHIDCLDEACLQVENDNIKSFHEGMLFNKREGGIK